MIIDVLTWNIGTTYDGSWNVVGGGTTIITSGSTIVVKLNDATHSLSAWKNGSIELADGPNLFFGYNGSATLATVAPFYQYCSGTTLRQVGTSNGYPYGTLGSNSNASECQVAPTCDLEISSIYTITPATGPGNADGSIVGSGTSSNGTVKYSFDPDFNYGDPFDSHNLPALEDWVVINTSSEPMSWADGIPSPVLTVTGNTVQPLPKSDQIGVVQSFTAGELYKYAFSYTVFSDAPVNTRYVFVYAQILTAFDIVLAERILSGYGSTGGTLLSTVNTGLWQFIMPAGAAKLVVFVEYRDNGVVVPNNDSVVINSFIDTSGNVADPGVQEDLNFTALLPGPYTIYAKDAAGCQDNISFEIPVTVLYNVKYRLEFTDTLEESQKPNRVDILERAYIGVITEVCGSDRPIVVRYEGNRDDASVSFVPSNTTLQLMVETEGEFNELLQGDDRKYLVNHYIDNGSGLELYWTGYIVPEFHSEPYLHTPYPLDVVAADGLGELKNKEFKDLNGNIFKGDLKAIKIIAEILKNTGLSLNIRCGINVFDAAMTTAATDDPLDQAYIDTRIYYTSKKVASKCDYVIKSILDPFRAQFFQSNGVWWIIRLSDAVGTFAYREFNSEGEYVSNSTFNPIVELDDPTSVHAGGKAMFSNRSQILSFIRNYGYFAITHDLKKDGNLIDSGAFESEDIIELGSGNKTFKDWSVLLGQGGVQYGHEAVVNGDSTGAFYFDFTGSTGNQVDTELYTAIMPLDSPSGRIRIKFQYFTNPVFNVPYTRIAWALKFRKANDGQFIWLTYATNGAITYSFVEAKNEIFITQYEQWVTFDLLTTIPFGFDFDGFQFSLYFHDHRGRDFASITALRAFDPSSLSNPLGTKIMVVDDPFETSVYTLDYSYDADDAPDTIRPDNYDAGDGNHRWIWVLDKILNLIPSTGIVQRIKFDNVSIAFYPLVLQPTTQYIDPPQTLVYEEETDVLVKPNLEKDILLGDMIRFDASSFRNERYLYRSYFRLEDGTPTTFWARAGVDESKKLLQILLEDYVSQFSLPQRRLSGVKITTTVMHFVNCLRDNIDGARYRPMTFEFDVKNAMYTPDMAAVIAGEDGEPPFAPGQFDNQEFSTAFSIGN